MTPVELLPEEIVGALKRSVKSIASSANHTEHIPYNRIIGWLRWRPWP
jgi:hypothetical protein